MLNVMRKKMIEKLRINISKLEKRARESRKSLQINVLILKLDYMYTKSQQLLTTLMNIICSLQSQ